MVCVEEIRERAVVTRGRTEERYRQTHATHKLQVAEPLCKNALLLRYNLPPLIKDFKNTGLNKRMLQITDA